MLEFSQGKE